MWSKLILFISNITDMKGAGEYYLIVVVSLKDILENIYRILAGLHWNQSLSPSYYCTPVRDQELRAAAARNSPPFPNSSFHTGSR
jgi:hypothetical protein